MKETFDVSVEGLFSGPLDLLCTLVETRQLDASKIKVSQIVRIYSAYLSASKRAAIETVAEFFYMASGLILEKTRSLLPSLRQEEPILEDDDPEMEDVEEVLERYRPYRAAGRMLWDKLEAEGRSFRRVLGDETQDPLIEAEYDIGDVYFLARVWWGLFERYSAEKADALRRMMEDDSADWDGFTEAVPDESLIENRIEEISTVLAEAGTLMLSVLIGEARTVKLLVVTLLALLEMCRMGRASVEQDELFSDVRVNLISKQ